MKAYKAMPQNEARTNRRKSERKEGKRTKRKEGGGMAKEVRTGRAGGRIKTIKEVSKTVFNG